MTTTQTTNTLRRTGMGNLWTVGTFKGYKVEAKVFEEAGEYSLPGTTISILWVQDSTGKLVCSYDRGDWECSILADDILSEITAAIEDVK